MVPSSFMISQITDAGLQPAMAARSQPASVWPARMSTPPSTACSGKMWPGCTRSVATALRRHRHLHGARAVGGRNAGGHAFGGFDGDGEGRAVLGAVARGHGRQLQALAALAGERQADQAAAKAGHEVDGLGRHVVGGQHQVAFVFAVFFVDQDDHAPGAHVGHDVFDGRDGHGGEGGGHGRLELSVGAAGDLPAGGVLQHRFPWPGAMVPPRNRPKEHAMRRCRTSKGHIAPEDRDFSALGTGSYSTGALPDADRRSDGAALQNDVR